MFGIKILLFEIYDGDIWDLGIGCTLHAAWSLLTIFSQMNYSWWCRINKWRPKTNSRKVNNKIYYFLLFQYTFSYILLFCHACMLTGNHENDESKGNGCIAPIMPWRNFTHIDILVYNLDCYYKIIKYLVKLCLLRGWNILVE